MYTCAVCRACSCEKEGHPAMPKNCPIADEDKMSAILGKYEPYRDFFAACARVEAEGYCQWPRLRETIELCKKMDYQKLGLAFCGGLRSEARVVEALLRQKGFEVVSVVCKLGGTDKEDFGLPADHKVRPGSFEPICNPIGQAELLNEQQTDFNIVLGLCVGHDSLFLKHSAALATVLVAKDRVMGHNPCAAIYTANTYCKSKL